MPLMYLSMYILDSRWQFLGPNGTNSLLIPISTQKGTSCEAIPIAPYISTNLLNRFSTDRNTNRIVQPLCTASMYTQNYAACFALQNRFATSVK